MKEVTIISYRTVVFRN